MNITEERIKTNLLMLDYFDMWDEFHFKSINDVKTMRYYNLISNLIDSQIDASIRWIDSKEAEEFFTGESAYQTEAFQTLEKEWDNILEGKYPSVEALLNEVYRRGKAKGYTDMREHIKYTEADKQALKIARNYNYHLIRKLDNDTRNQIKNKITEAVITGEHPNKLAPKILSIAEERLQGSTFSPKQRATMIARTEISRVQNTGILQSYINEGYTEVKILTAEDNNVCTTCLKYAFDFNKDEKITFENRGKERVHDIIKLIKGEQFPPFHPLCRCTYLSVWNSKEEPPENPLVIDLTPNSQVKFLQDFHDDSDTFEVLPYSQLTEDKLPDIFSENIVKGFLVFDKKIQDAKYEYTYISNLTTDEVGKIYTDYKPNRVNPRTNIVINFGDELIATHNHRSHMPFNRDDFKIIFKNANVNVKYLVVHTPTDVFICELDFLANYHCDELLKEINTCYGEGLREASTENYDAANKIWNKYKSNKVLNKYMSFRRIRK